MALFVILTIIFAAWLFARASMGATASAAARLHAAACERDLATSMAFNREQTRAVVEHARAVHGTALRHDAERRSS